MICPLKSEESLIKYLSLDVASMIEILNLLKSEVLYVFRSASFLLNSGRLVWIVS